MSGKSIFTNLHQKLSDDEKEELKTQKKASNRLGFLAESRQSFENLCNKVSSINKKNNKAIDPETDSLLLRNGKK